MKNKLILKFVICEICKFPNEIITFLKKKTIFILEKRQKMFWILENMPVLLKAFFFHNWLNTINGWKFVALI